MAPKIILLSLIAGICILVSQSYGKPSGEVPVNYNNQYTSIQKPQQPQQPQPQQDAGIQAQFQQSANSGAEVSGNQVSGTSLPVGTYIPRPQIIPVFQYIPAPNVGSQIPIGYPIGGGTQAVPGNLGPNVQIIGLPQNQQSQSQHNNGIIYVLVGSPVQPQTPINSGIQFIPVGYPSYRPILPYPQPQIVQIQIPQTQTPQVEEPKIEIPQIPAVEIPELQKQPPQKTPEVKTQIKIEVPTETYKPLEQNKLYIPKKPAVIQPQPPVNKKPQPQTQVQLQSNTKVPSGIYKPQNPETYKPVEPVTKRPQNSYQDVDIKVEQAPKEDTKIQYPSIDAETNYGELPEIDLQLGEEAQQPSVYN